MLNVRIVRNKTENILNIPDTVQKYVSEFIPDILTPQPSVQNWCILSKPSVKSVPHILGRK